jgi:hypothetical protein
MCWLPLGALSWHSKHSNTCVSSQEQPSTHLLASFLIQSEIRRDLVHLFSWFASSGTSLLFEPWFSCYSWWLLPPRWLGGLEDCWGAYGDCSPPPIELIVRGSCAHPCGRSRRATLVECSWLVGLLLVDWFLRHPSWGSRLSGYLAHESSCWDLPQWWHRLLASHRTSGINLVFISCPVSAYLHLTLALYIHIY